MTILGCCISLNSVQKVWLCGELWIHMCHLLKKLNKIVHFFSEDQAKAVMRVDSNLGLDHHPKKATEGQMIIIKGESKLTRLPYLT